MPIAYISCHFINPSSVDDVIIDYAEFILIHRARAAISKLTFNQIVINMCVSTIFDLVYVIILHNNLGDYPLHPLQSTLTMEQEKGTTGPQHS